MYGALKKQKKLNDLIIQYKERPNLEVLNKILRRHEDWIIKVKQVYQLTDEQIYLVYERELQAIQKHPYTGSYNHFTHRVLWFLRDLYRHQKNNVK